MTSPMKFIAEANALLASVKGKSFSIHDLQDKTIELAALLMKEVHATQTVQEKARQEQLARLMNDPTGKIFATCMTDQCFRSQCNSRIADQLCYLMKKFGVPKFLSFDKRLEMKLFKTFGKLFSPLLVPSIKNRLKKETSTVILPGEKKKLFTHMAKRRKEGVRLNINHLGEAVLGEEEALRRLAIYKEDLSDPEIEYISVKISTIYSQLNLLDWDQTLEVLSERLRELFDIAQTHYFMNKDGVNIPKFVNLDMEEYRDFHLTIALFCKVLSEPQYKDVSAGIVLQSYLPDASLLQKQLTAWAVDRFSRGGAPIKIRIVKGANLAMERVDASLHNWPQAPYSKKIEADANFKRMVEYGCHPIRAKSVHIGVASHNLFDIALALLLRSQNNVEECVSFEMLEGMADSLRKVVQRISGDMLLYCPVAKEEEFQNAVAYLIRRLDENTAPENFLRSFFGLQPESNEWKRQASFFSSSLKVITDVSEEPRRIQNRQNPPLQPDAFSPFKNEADTDWSIPHNVEWGKQLLNDWRTYKFEEIPLVIAGNVITKTNANQKGHGKDPSIPDKKLFNYSLAGQEEINAALIGSQNALAAWSVIPATERSTLLAKIAVGLRQKRRELIGAMVANTGKTIYEADSEVSEAIDFAEYYRRNLEELYNFPDIEWAPKGTILVAPPWNFPCSIPAGGILAALASGNCVLFKPSPEAVGVAWFLANIFWEAGISREVLQFIPCEDDPTGSMLIKDLRVAGVILTGATSTAKHFLKLRPDIYLMAETGGKNAMIITSLADRDLAIKDILTSAFGYNGQKCSACSLIILEAEVYDDPHFRAQLRDAVMSLCVGSAWEMKSKVTPLIIPPKEGSLLHQALIRLESGEEWLIEPKQNLLNPNLWSPGVKLGVQSGSITHQTEFFGPLLGVMRANNLLEAIGMANGTRYGLTSGLHSLDSREKDIWCEKIEAGNCYVNRGVTGAIVQRQPFGGYKESSFGCGFKSGGPNSLIPLMNATQKDLPKEKAPLSEALEKVSSLLMTQNFSDEQKHQWHISVGNYSFYWSHYFSKGHDSSLILGQDNKLSYRPHKHLLLRLSNGDGSMDLWRAIAASVTVGGYLEISTEKGLPNVVSVLTADQELRLNVTVESEEQLIQRLPNGKIRQVRMFSAPSQQLQDAFSKVGCNVKIGPTLANGRIELLNYLREVSLSYNYHRYGNVGERELASEKKF